MKMETKELKGDLIDELIRSHFYQTHLQILKQERQKAERFYKALIKKTIKEGYRLSVGDIKRIKEEIYDENNV